MRKVKPTEFKPGWIVRSTCDALREYLVLEEPITTCVHSITRVCVLVIAQENVKITSVCIWQVFLNKSLLWDLVSDGGNP